MKSSFIFVFIVTFGIALNAHAGRTTTSQAIPEICFKPTVYKFGLKIQKAVKEKDLSALYSLVEGELFHGPRRAFIKGKTFDEVFPVEWRQGLLEEEPPCSGSWRGYVISWDEGNVVYWADEDGGYITKIGGVVPEIPEESIKNKWSYKGKTLSGWCFTIMHLSQDNYQEFHEKFAKNEEYYEFYRFIGKYLVKKVPLQPKDSYALAMDLNQCSGKVNNDGKSERIYKVLKKVSLKDCNSLAPHIQQPCQVALLVYIRDWGGGNLYQKQTGLYGIFSLSNGANAYVVPLANFDSTNDALNFLDDQGIHYEAP